MASVLTFRLVIVIIDDILTAVIDDDGILQEVCTFKNILFSCLILLNLLDLCH